MAVDLGDLIESVRAAVNVPGEELFPLSTDDDWLNRLVNGFWNARLKGLFTEYREVDGSIIPIDETAEDLSREYQQLIVLWAAYVAVRNRLIALPTSSRDKAGPVETETGYSAQVFQAVLEDLRTELDEAAKELAEGGDPTPVYVFDALLERERAAHGGVASYWLR